MLDILLQKILDLITIKFTSIKTKLNTLYENIGGGGDIDSLIDRTITTISSDVLEIGISIFSNCTALTTAIFPNATSIKNEAFRNCSSLVNISFPKVVSVGTSSFNGCSSLTEINDTIFPLVESFGTSSFNNCSHLTTVNLPLIKTVNNAFQSCAALTTLNIPKVTGLGSLQNCTALVNVSDFEELTTLGANTFLYCTSLKKLVFNKLNSLNNGAFASSGLNELVLKNSTMVACNMTAFAGTPFFTATGDGGKIYVPSELVTTYQNDSTWSQLMMLNANNQILAIT